MPGHDLEVRLGEISGKLEAVCGTLEVIAEKLDNVLQRVSSLEPQVKLSRELFKEQIEALQKRLESGDKRFEDDRLAIEGMRTDLQHKIDAANKEIGLLQTHRDKSGSKLWELVKIATAALVGALVSWFAGKRP